MQPNNDGMSLRDYFAASAMQGLIASEAFHGPLYQQQPSMAASFAYEVADAMLSERSKKGVTPCNPTN